MVHEGIESLAGHGIRIDASERVRDAALVSDYDAWFDTWNRNPDAFWDAAARDLDWFTPWDRVCEIDLPDHRWFGRRHHQHFLQLFRAEHRARVGAQRCAAFRI